MKEMDEKSSVLGREKRGEDKTGGKIFWVCIENEESLLVLRGVSEKGWVF